MLLLLLSVKCILIFVARSTSLGNGISQAIKVFKKTNVVYSVSSSVVKKLL